jgi:hypothetical protein
MLKDVLKDIVQYTNGVNGVDVVKITGNLSATKISAIGEKKSVIILGETKFPVPEFSGTFGIPNLTKLKTILGFGEYEENPDISVQREQRDGEDLPVSVNFNNAAGDFGITFRLMGKTLIEDRIKDVKFNGATWNLSFTPSLLGVQRFKSQAAANNEESSFTLKSVNDGLKVNFGNTGTFVFHSGLDKSISRPLKFPVKQFLVIMEMVGNKVVSISEQGVMRITIDSGISTYNYFLPAQM